jgi:hypothetical protein
MVSVGSRRGVVAGIRDPVPERIVAELIVGQESKASRARSEEADRIARAKGWAILGWVGLLFVLVGGVDLSLAIWPIAFRDPTWEFGTAVTILSGLSVLTLGLGLALVSAVCLRKAGLIRTLAIVLAVLCVLVLAVSLLLATTAPMALRGVTDPVVQLGVRKAIAKGAALAVFYSVAFAWLAVQGWKLSARV